MDEPFGAPDALTRAHLRTSGCESSLKTRSTVATVTYDVDEAVPLADRTVMR